MPLLLGGGHTPSIIPKPELRGDSLSKPQFKVTNWRVGRYNLPRGMDTIAF